MSFTDKRTSVPGERFNDLPKVTLFKIRKSKTKQKNHQAQYNLRLDFPGSDVVTERCKSV